MEHTELPWKSKSDIVYIGDYGKGQRIAMCLYTNEDKQDEANAEFIVQACNRDAAFEDLLTACEALVAFCESKERLNGDDVCPTKAYDLAKTALKKKRGE